jgi:hypothetical protein
MSRANGDAREIEQEITTLRDELGDLVGELDRRRREAFDLRLQARRHPLAASAAGLALAALLGGSIALLVRGARRRRRLSYQMRQLGLAFGRIARDPGSVARSEPPAAERILVAAGTAAATMLVRRTLERALPRTERAAKAAR